MLYSEYIARAKKMCIQIDEETDKAYLIPDYRYILHLSGMNLDSVEDFKDVTDQIVDDNLRLEVTKYNTLHDKSYLLFEDLADFLDGTVKPVMSEFENGLLEKVYEQLVPKEKPVERKLPQTIGSMSGFNFSKKQNK